jgi:hypothetical protein
VCEKRENDATDEIEITPAMIEVGERELRRFDKDYESHSAAVMRIYIAMHNNRKVQARVEATCNKQASRVIRFSYE